MPDRRLEPPRAGVQSAGQSQITRRRLFAKAGDVALGICAASSPFLAGCTQAAPTTAVPITAAAPSGGRAPFQIMALRDYRRAVEPAGLAGAGRQGPPLSGRRMAGRTS